MVSDLKKKALLVIWNVAVPDLEVWGQYPNQDLWGKYNLSVCLRFIS